MALDRAIADEQTQLSSTIRERLQAPTVRRALWVRLGLALGIVGLMVGKPDFVTSLVVMAAAATLGYAASLGIVRGATAIATVR